MGQDPAMIRQEIEQTRERLGDTVEALGDKADVKGRIAGRAHDLRDKVTGATPSTGDVKHGAHQVKGIAEENPLGLALGGLAIGLLAGLALPATRMEREKVGPIADQVREAGQEALSRGADVAADAASSAADAAKETVSERAPEEARELQDSMRS